MFSRYICVTNVCRCTMLSRNRVIVNVIQADLLHLKQRRATPLISVLNEIKRGIQYKG